MNTEFHFLVLAASLPRRGERINLGMAVCKGGEWRVRIHPDAQSRLRGLHPDFATLDLTRWAVETDEMLARLEKTELQRYWLETAGGPVVINGGGSLLDAESGESEAALDKLFNDLVGRPPAIRQRPRKAPESRLYGEVKRWFRSARIFSPRLEDISRHKIVPGYPVSLSENLFAEFALKNGALHVMETIDLRGADRLTASRFGSVASKILVLDQTRQTLGKQSRRLVVTAASDYKSVSPAISLLHKYADDVIAYESAEDRQRLAEFLAGALHLGEVLPVLSNEVGDIRKV
jgi:hypothetical protein